MTRRSVNWKRKMKEHNKRWKKWKVWANHFPPKEHVVCDLKSDINLCILNCLVLVYRNCGINIFRLIIWAWYLLVSLILLNILLWHSNELPGEVLSVCMCIELWTHFTHLLLKNWNSCPDWCSLGVGCCPMNWKVSSLIAGQGSFLGCGPGPGLGACKNQPIHVSLSYPFLSLSFPLTSSLFRKKEMDLKKKKNPEIASKSSCGCNFLLFLNTILNFKTLHRVQ